MRNLHMPIIRISLGLLAAVGLALALAPAFADRGINVGVLTCRTVPDIHTNLLILSAADIRCKFKTPSGQERYKGKTGIAFGADLNINISEEMSFAVLAGVSDVEIGKHALAGQYYGDNASATLFAGTGAAGLVGGGKKGVSLQPLDVGTNSGLGVAGGVGFLILEPDAAPK